MKDIFIVDDERILRVSLADDLRDAGYRVMEFSEPMSALSHLNEHNADVILTDLKMPQMDGIEFLKRIKEKKPEVVVVIMTSYATFPTAVQAIKLGAYDFITKPFPSEAVLLMLERVKELKNVNEENFLLRSQLKKNYDFSTLKGSKDEIRKITGMVKIIADTTSTVLIIGETGTGKELLTNIIHFNSNRKQKPLVKVSCAVLAREVFESELFGHTKGAFTGADRDKKGRFEIANGGTLFLDDIDDIPFELQVKLLRAIEEREIEKVGSSETVKIDVRIIASTKTDLKQLAESGKFREDLYYRLNVFPITLKPLRQRKDDIPLLFDFFLKNFLENKSVTIGNEVMELLKKYHWPGNIRELKNIAERSAILAQNGVVTASLLPKEIISPSFTAALDEKGDKPLVEALEEFERSAITNALLKFAGNKTRAAEFLGIPPSTLRTKMDKYGFE